MGGRMSDVPSIKVKDTAICWCSTEPLSCAHEVWLPAMLHDFGFLACTRISCPWNTTTVSIPTDIGSDSFGGRMLAADRYALDTVGNKNGKQPR
jgi:hypothetical protein